VLGWGFSVSVASKTLIVVNQSWIQTEPADNVRTANTMQVSPLAAKAAASLGMTIAGILIHLLCPPP
jgi:hypothetical protein